MKTWDKVVRERVNKVKSQKASGDFSAQIPTGIKELDKFGGIEIGILTVIAGATGDGKSILKLHLMEQAARAGFNVLALDFEDPQEKTADRTLASKTNIASFKIGRLDVTKEEIERLELAAKEAESWGTKIKHVAGLMSAEAVKQCLKENPEAKLVLVDYAQALPAFDRSLERVIAEISWDLNIDAQRNSRAVVMFSQVKREVEERGQDTFRRTNKVDGYRPGPGKSDLQWSSAMGDRAKALWYIFRPGRWARKVGISAKDDVMEIIVDKANFGKEGLVTVGFDGEHVRIYNK